MPLVEVTHDPQLDPARLRHLAETLPHAVSVECPEEPYDGDLQPGDIDLRFRPRGAYDSGGLDIVVEVRTTWYGSRADTRQERCDRLRDQVARAADPASVGVYLCLPVAAWAQSG